MASTGVTLVKSTWKQSGDEGDLVFTNNSGTELFQIDATNGPTTKGRVGGVAFTVGAEAANAITVNVQMNDGNGDAMTVRSGLYFYLSDDANGDSIAATAPSTSVAAGTDGFIDDVTAKKSFMGISEADGDLDVVITETGADTWYLVAVLPDGRLSVSGAITFAA